MAGVDSFTLFRIGFILVVVVRELMMVDGGGWVVCRLRKLIAGDITGLVLLGRTRGGAKEVLMTEDGRIGRVI